MKLTRRKLATVLASAAVAAAQQPQPAPANVQPVNDLTGNDLVKAARDRMHANAAALATPAIPIAIEPAFQFKA